MSSTNTPDTHVGFAGFAAILAQSRAEVASLPRITRNAYGDLIETRRFAPENGFDSSDEEAATNEIRCSLERQANAEEVAGPKVFPMRFGGYQLSPASTSSSEIGGGNDVVSLEGLPPSRVLAEGVPRTYTRPFAPMEPPVEPALCSDGIGCGNGSSTRHLYRCKNARVVSRRVKGKIKGVVEFVAA